MLALRYSIRNSCRDHILLFMTENIFPISVNLLKAEVINSNNRIYTSSCVENMVHDFNRNKTKGQAIFGRIGIQDTFDFDLRDSALEVEELCIKEGILMAKISFLPNENGRLAKTMLRLGGAVIRPTSIGKVRDSGKGYDEVYEVERVVSYDLIDAKTDAFKDILPKQYFDFDLPLLDPTSYRREFVTKNGTIVRIGKTPQSLLVYEAIKPFRFMGQTMRWKWNEHGQVYVRFRNYEQDLQNGIVHDMDIVESLSSKANRLPEL